MPVTRASSRQASHQPSGRPYPRSSGSGGTTKLPKSPSNHEIIVLSSDDDEPPPKGTTTKKPPGRKVKRKAVQPVHADDVLDISSDDNAKPNKPSKGKQVTVQEVQRDNQKLKEELARTKQLLEEFKCDSLTKIVLSSLDEQMSCEVCSHTMWCPYVLPECGHSFCEQCLLDWFGTIQAQHMTTNPQLDGNRAALAGQIQAFVQLAPNLHTYGPNGRHHARAILDELRRHRPDYTCPSCRKRVVTKPVEDFRLKSLVRQIAELMDETNPHKDVPRNPGVGSFDHFFAAPTSG